MLCVYLYLIDSLPFFFFFFFNDTATTEIYTSFPTRRSSDLEGAGHQAIDPPAEVPRDVGDRLPAARSEEHTSELQSRLHLVCRLLLEKKKKKYNTRRISILKYTYAPLATVVISIHTGGMCDK